MTDQEIRDFAKALTITLEDLADDGKKLLSVTYNYPKGWRAWEVGFSFGAGFLCSVAGIVFLGALITKALS